MKKNFVAVCCFFTLVSLLSAAVPGGKNAKFMFKSDEILQYSTNQSDGTGYAILTHGRLLYYKEWKTEEANAVEITEIDPNYVDDGRDWQNSGYVENRIIKLAKMALTQEEFEFLKKAFEAKSYKKESGLGGSVFYHISKAGYSEFYFEIKLPVHALDNACIRMRMVMTL